MQCSAKGPPLSIIFSFADDKERRDPGRPNEVGGITDAEDGGLEPHPSDPPILSAHPEEPIRKARIISWHNMVDFAS